MINNQLLFSICSGHNIYLPVSKKEGEINVTVSHFFTDQKFNLRIENVKKTDTVLIKKILSSPPKSNNIIWPVDAIFLKDTCYEECGNLGLIYLKRALPKMNKLKDILYSPDDLDWRNKSIKKLALNLTEVLVELERAGYVYHAFDIDNIFYDPETMEVLFNYSLSINDEKRQRFFLDVKDIKRDFQPPWLEREKMQGGTEISSMRYAYSSMLFRLLIGKLPYQGQLSDDVSNLMLKYRDEDSVVHELMVDAYLTKNVFLFDEKDKSNSIGTFSSEQIYIDRWNELDDKLKTMFMDTFSAENLKEKSFYPIFLWHETLTKAWGNLR